MNKTKILFSCILLALFLAPFGGKASLPDSLPLSSGQAPPNNTRLYAVAGTQVASYTLSLFVLYQAWYKDYPKSSFHFHNDLPDWLQQDKLGHFTSTYHISRITAATYNWAGLSNKQSAWIGALSGTAMLTAVEIFDGFSAEWGFSVADAVANKLGAALFLSQQLAWQEQRIIAKYSYSHSGLARYRPSLLGSNLPEYMLKDYNGQTFWLSVNLNSAFFSGSKLPQWLNLAVGHGANGMLGSLENPAFINGTPLPDLERYRQWYIAPDIDLSRIPVRSHWLKAVLGGLNFLKFPAPALEYNRVDGVRFHWIFF